MVMVVASKKHLFPLLFILSICALLLYSLTVTRLDLGHPSTTQRFDRNLQPLNAFTLHIKVLTYNRLHSLSRCLESLASADYGVDRVHLHVYVDHFALVPDDLLVDQKLEESRGILDFVDGFDWKHGEKLVHYRTNNAGLQGQWLEAWWPSSDDDFAFVVEDDLQGSPLYYSFLKSVILNYYYNASNYSPYIYGASLQRPRFVPGKHGNKIQLDAETRLFLYQLVGTWGQLIFPKPWKEFRLWYDKHKSKGIKPVLDGMITTGWYKKMGERIWTPWFIKFIHSRGYFNIYTNFLHERALSVSHRDAGVNYGRTAGPDSQLLNASSLDFNLLEMQPLKNLKWYDFCFREVLPGRIVRNLDELGTVLHSIHKQDTIMLVSLFGESEMAIRNLLCHLEKLNSQNYIFAGVNSELMLDLSRRGHPVIDVDPFLNNIEAYKLMRVQDSNVNPMKEILLKIFVIKKCLETRYNTWVLNGNTLFVNNNLFLESSTATYDIYAGKSSELLFVRTSSSARKIWNDDFLYNVASISNKVSSPKENKSFVHLLSKMLEQKGANIKTPDEKSISLNINTNDGNNQSLGVDMKLVYWSAEIDPDSIKKRLDGLNMWIIDDDFSCRAVTCHQS